MGTSIPIALSIMALLICIAAGAIASNLQKLEKKYNLQIEYWIAEYNRLVKQRQLYKEKTEGLRVAIKGYLTAKEKFEKELQRDPLHHPDSIDHLIYGLNALDTPEPETELPPDFGHGVGSLPLTGIIFGSEPGCLSKDTERVWPLIPDGELKE